MEGGWGIPCYSEYGSAGIIPGPRAKPGQQPRGLAGHGCGHLVRAWDFDNPTGNLGKGDRTV